MKNTVWYKERWGNSCFTRSVRNAGIPSERYSVQKDPKRPKEAIPCWISLCPDCLVQLSGDHRPAWPNQPWSLLSLIEITTSTTPMFRAAALKICDWKQMVLKERENRYREVLVLRKPAEPRLFPWKKSYLHDKFTCSSDSGRIFPRKRNY